MYAEDDLFVKSPKTGLFLFLLDDTAVQDSIQNGSRTPPQTVFKSTMNALRKSVQGRGARSAYIGRDCPNVHLEKKSPQFFSSI